MPILLHIFDHMSARLIHLEVNLSFDIDFTSVRTVGFASLNMQPVLSNCTTTSSGRLAYHYRT